MGLVSSLGVDEAIDCTRQDFTRSGQSFEVVFEAVGKTSAKEVRATLTDNGVFISTRTRRTDRPADLTAVRDLLASRAITAVVDRTYPLDRVAEAHRYVEQGQKRGNVVIAISG